MPSFRQSDERWSDDPLGGVPDNGTLGGQGCAVAAAAMVFKFYGIETDPQQLNWFLTAVDGYTEHGWMCWWTARRGRRPTVFDAVSRRFAGIAQLIWIRISAREQARDRDGLWRRRMVGRTLSSSQARLGLITAWREPRRRCRESVLPRCASSTVTSKRCASTDR